MRIKPKIRIQRELLLMPESFQFGRSEVYPRNLQRIHLSLISKKKKNLRLLKNSILKYPVIAMPFFKLEEESTQYRRHMTQV